jgi:peptide deformylase
LAANQVGDNRRLFVTHVPDEQAEPVAYVNPLIIDVSKKTSKGREGCLSLPGVELLVPRHNTCQIEYQDLKGEGHYASSTGLLARVWQHEVDHLNGILIKDRVRGTGT